MRGGEPRAVLVLGDGDEDAEVLESGDMTAAEVYNRVAQTYPYMRPQWDDMPWLVAFTTLAHGPATACVGAESATNVDTADAADVTAMSVGSDEPQQSDGRAHAGFDFKADVGESERARLNTALLPLRNVWLSLEHQDKIATITSTIAAGSLPKVDAAIIAAPNMAAAFTTADCLPIVLACEDRPLAAAIHAGWRSLAAGIVEAVLAKMTSEYGASTRRMRVWIGPAIQREDYEVGTEVRASLLQRGGVSDGCFTATGSGRYLADLPACACAIFANAAVPAQNIGYCTSSTKQDPRMHSHRRDATASGRMATVVGVLASSDADANAGAGADADVVTAGDTGVSDTAAGSDTGASTVTATGTPTSATSAPDAVGASDPGMSVNAASKPPRKRLRAIKIALVAAGVLALAILATFIPTLSLETSGMQTYEGEYVTVYYESEMAAAKDVFNLAEAESERIAHELGFTSPQNIKVYIYDTQSTFQTKKYGYLAVLLGPVLGLDFYIGDNRGTNVLLTSPANPGPEHDYDSVKYAVVHEMVHAYTSLFDNKLSYWMDNGLATYLAGQVPSEDLLYWGPEPSLEQTHTENPIKFAEIDGYQFSYTYVEYLDKTYGWDSVLAFANTGDFVQALGVDESAIYDGWVEFLRGNYV